MDQVKVRLVLPGPIPKQTEERFFDRVPVVGEIIWTAEDGEPMYVEEVHWRMTGQASLLMRKYYKE